MIRNPIIRGFNPDPSIIRVGEDYYIACSTFEWYPGIQIHHSKDLVNWELIARPLNEYKLINLKGVPDSCGVWAPCLSYSDGIYYLVYSNVKSFDGVWKDTPNYLITSESIHGPWSDPVFLGSHGFDGSLFHDDDGKKWYTSMLVDHRNGKFFGGIILQEYNPELKRLVGDLYHIFDGSQIGKTEGPHLYKKDGYYYLITAEGGTEYGHAVTIARSKLITGPYELHPSNPVLSSSGDPSWDLQKTGHGDFVWNDKGECYLVFLAARPLTELGNCPLGRETCIEEVDWKSGEWPIIKSGISKARLEIPNDIINTGTTPLVEELDFSKCKLSIHYQSLRVPVTKDWLSYDNSSMVLTGRESLSSLHLQSLVARRVQSFYFEYIIELCFKPFSFQQMAGMVCYYNTSHFYYFNVAGGDEADMNYLNLIKCDNGNFRECMPQPVLMDKKKNVHLKCRWLKDKLWFMYSLDNISWIDAGDVQDANILSDDYVREGFDYYRPAFTGAFVGMACQDLTGIGLKAFFKCANYKELQL